MKWIQVWKKFCNDVGERVGYPKDSEVLGLRRTLTKFGFDFTLLAFVFLPKSIYLLATSENVMAMIAARAPLIVGIALFMLVAEFGLVHLYWNPKARKNFEPK